MTSAAIPDTDADADADDGYAFLLFRSLQYGLSLSSSSERVYTCDKKEAQTETKALQDSAGVKVGADAEGGVDAAKKVEGVMADVAAAAADVAPAKGAAPVKVEVEVRGLPGGGGAEWYQKVLEGIRRYLKGTGRY